MEYPDAAKYGEFYGEDRKPTEEYERYTRDIAGYHDHVAKIRAVFQYLWDLDHEQVGVELLGRELASTLHRTEQQGACRTIRKILEAMADAEWDGRNEAMVTFAQFARQATSGIALPLI